MKQWREAIDEARAHLELTQPEPEPTPQRPGECSAHGCPLPGALAAGHGAPWYCGFHHGVEGDRFVLVTRALRAHMPLAQQYRRELREAPAQVYATRKALLAAIVAYYDAHRPAPKLADMVALPTSNDGHA